MIKKIDKYLGVLTLDTFDGEGYTPPHYACRGAKYKNTMALLLKK